MKKTIFIGKINDKAFDNVYDYNSALMAIQKTGEPFTASSEMKTVDVQDEILKDNKKVLYILPGFLDIKNPKYMDEVYTEQEYEKMFKEALDNISRMSEEQLSIYKGKLDAILNKLEEDADVTESKMDEIEARKTQIDEEISKLCQERDGLEDKYEVLENTIAACNEYGEFYNSLMDYVEDKISVDEKDKYDNARDKERCECGECECGCECRCTEEQKECIFGPGIDNLLLSINDELGKIFNKYTNK